MKKKKFKVTVEYRGTVEVEVEAKDEFEARFLALEQADEEISHELRVYGADAEEVER